MYRTQFPGHREGYAVSGPDPIVGPSVTVRSRFEEYHRDHAGARRSAPLPSSNLPLHKATVGVDVSDSSNAGRERYSLDSKSVLVTVTGIGATGQGSIRFPRTSLLMGFRFRASDVWLGSGNFDFRTACWPYLVSLLTPTSACFSFPSL